MISIYLTVVLFDCYLLLLLLGLLILINPETSKARRFLHYGFLHIPTSSFFLNLSFLYQKQLIWKIVFPIYFWWIRIYKQTDAIFYATKHLLGYIKPDSTVFPNLISGLIVGFTLLNLYWGTLIILKINKVLKLIFIK